MKLRTLISSLMVLALATSCGSSSSGSGGGSSNALVGTVSTVLSQANIVSGVLDSAKKNQLITSENLVTDEYLTTEWWDTDLSLPNPITGMGNVTLRKRKKVETYHPHLAANNKMFIKLVVKLLCILF